MARQLSGTTIAGENLPRMTYEEFREWAGEETRAEWVDGEVTILEMPDERHQDISVFLTTLLNLFVLLRQLGKILSAPFEMRLGAVRSAREPDLLFVAARHMDRLDGKRLNGPADLAIEIVSSDSVARDNREKFAEYAMAGVPEYWIIDPRPGKLTFRIYHLADNGTYAELEADPVGRMHSIVLPGFWLDPDWLWQDRLPNPAFVLRQIAPGIL